MGHVAVAGGARRVERARLPRPAVFEFPHYLGSPADARAVAGLFEATFQRVTLFPGALSLRDESTARSLGLVFPFVVTDPNGTHVLPENLGHYALEDGAGGEAAEARVAELARRVHVVRDGVAAFFFHPVYDVAILERLVSSVQAAGFTFVPAEALLPPRAPPTSAR